MERNLEKHKTKERRERQPTPGTKEFYERQEEEEEYGEP